MPKSAMLFNLGKIFACGTVMPRELNRFRDNSLAGHRPMQHRRLANRNEMTFPLSKFLPALLFMPVLFALRGAAQEPEDRKPQKPESMGVATGTPHAPVKDALSRPITAGGFVDGAPVVFTA